MAFIKHRPGILVYVPREISPGVAFNIRAVVDCKFPVPVTSVDVELVGVCAWIIRTQNSRYRDEEQFFRSVARVHRGGELGQGRHEYPVRFRLPADVPASYVGEALRIEYTVRVRVNIPWWPAAQASFLVQVVAGSSSIVDEQRVVYSSGARALQQHKPYAELSLGASTLRPGAALRGAVALSNVAYNTYRGLQMELVAAERYPTLFGQHSNHRRSHKWTIPIAEPVEGKPIHFSLALPDDLVPGFTCGRCSLEWYLVLRVDVAWAPNPRMWVPVVVLGKGGGDDKKEELPVPLAVGAERRELVWRKVAEKAGFRYDGRSLSTSVDGVDVQITREHDGRRGVFLVARLLYPDLGVGLSVAGRPPEVRLLGRDQGQVTHLAAALADVVSRCPLVRADDREMRCELRDGGQRAHTLEGFVDGARALATALAQALPRIPPPACMAEMVPAWERTARALGGRLVHAAMRIEAATDQMPFQLKTHWDELGRPSRTVLELRPKGTIDTRYRMAWTIAQGLESLVRRGLPLAELCSGARGLAIDAEHVRVVLSGPLEDPSREMQRVATLVRVGHRLSGRAGVYR